MSTTTTTSTPENPGYVHGTVRHLERGHYVRDIPGEYCSGGDPLTIHLAARDDTSAAHRSYPHGYAAACSWCYLSAPHSIDAHERATTEGRDAGL